MSRAFVKDDDTGPERPIARQASDAPNYVTPRGLAQLRDRLARAQQAGDERDATYYRERVDSAIIVDRPSDDVVEIGASVRARDDRGNELVLHIVGEDEADPSHRAISWTSPIASALRGHRVGDRVNVVRPAGPIAYTIEAIGYDRSLA